MRMRKILLAEDDARDIELTLAALEEYNLANRVVVARDGAEALDYLYCKGKYVDREKIDPIVVLLDLKMPKMSGLDVLREVKHSKELRKIPIVVLTSSKEDQDIVESYGLGVNAYVVKPVEFEKFAEAIRQISLFWILTNEPPPVR
ncbi:MAG: response regulator [Desulfobacteraceae bacterium]|nr:response regulator [Desulfobacteraceae bacterium]